MAPDAPSAPKDQADAFRHAAREPECDEDEARWNVRLKKVDSAPSRKAEPESR